VASLTVIKKGNCESDILIGFDVSLAVVSRTGTPLIHLRWQRIQVLYLKQTLGIGILGKGALELMYAILFFLLPRALTRLCDGWLPTTVVVVHDA
jgi:hypothetical protein